MKRIIIIGLFSILFLVGRTGYPTDLQVLKYSPVRYFSETDWELAKSTAREVLNNHADHEVGSWENPETGNSGSLVVIRTGKVDGQTCKKLQIHNKANNLEGNAVYLFCQQADGKWKSAGMAPQ
ncbi:MAG: RT0821/Lpp0805 family surface protein [Gammaproteobacteria bacterium]|nr:RT0821/Lpp0805 family surface protein [Gammaproteobacteria bacterium]